MSGFSTSDRVCFIDLVDDEMDAEPEWNGPMYPPSLMYWSQTFSVGDRIQVHCRLYNRFLGYLPPYYWI